MGLYLCATSTGTTNSLRINPVGPPFVDRTSNQSPCLFSTDTFVPVVNVTSESEVKFGYLRSAVGYLIWNSLASFAPAVGPFFSDVSNAVFVAPAAVAVLSVALACCVGGGVAAGGVIDVRSAQ